MGVLARDLAAINVTNQNSINTTEKILDAKPA
jgi:hypothetical protein